MSELIKGLSDLFRKKQHGEKITGSAGFPLTESLQFMLREQTELSLTDVDTISNTPGYNLLAPYYGLKLLDNQPELQRALLTGLVDTYASRGGYAGAAELVKDNLNRIHQDKSHIPLTKVTQKELARIAQWGPYEINERAQNIMSETRKNEEIPVIVAYGGLIALKAAIESENIGDRTILIFPKNLTKTTSIHGYISTKSTPNKHRIEVFHTAELPHDSRIALIDDARHSGNTFKQVKQSFLNIESIERPLYQT